MNHEIVEALRDIEIALWAITSVLSGMAVLYFIHGIIFPKD